MLLHKIYKMEAAKILLKHNLRNTACRQGIINVIQKAKRALSEQEIKQSLSKKHDRTTFYRSFKTLEEKGVIHRVLLKGNETKYAIEHFCEDEDCSHVGNGEHMHFVCEKCDKVECLQNNFLFNPTLPEGYSITHKEFLITGICSTCQCVNNI